MSDEWNNQGKDDQNDSSEKQGGNAAQSQYSFWAEQIASNQEKTSKSEDASVEQQEMSSQQETQDDVHSNERQYHQTDFGGQEQASAYHPDYSNMDFGQYDSFQTDMNSGKERKDDRKAKKVVQVVTAAIAAGVIAGGCFVGVVSAYHRFSGNKDEFNLSIGSNIEKIPSTTVLDSAVIPETEVTKVYQNTLPSIVAIDSTISEPVNFFGHTYEQEATGNGSGIIVGKTDTELLIATNNHVVDGAKKIEVTFIDGTKGEGITKGTDATADLAVVAIDITTLSKDTLSQIKVASLGNSDKVLEGEMAIAIGNALGYGQSITVGYISAVNRKVEFEDRSMELLQTDAAINPGNSGGALINTEGEVIGINSAKLAAASIEGMGYAIPISYAYPILEELMSREIIKEEDQGYLGVYYQDITEDISQAYSMPMGVYIREFVEGSPAETAGLMERDIITSVEDVEVTTGTALKEKVNSYKYGTTVKVTVQRSVDGEYKEMTFDVTLTKNPKYAQSQSESKSEDSQSESGNE